MLPQDKINSNAMYHQKSRNHLTVRIAINSSTVQFLQSLSWGNAHGLDKMCHALELVSGGQNADCQSSLVFHSNSKTLCETWGGTGTSRVRAINRSLLLFPFIFNYVRAL